LQIESKKYLQLFALFGKIFNHEGKLYAKKQIRTNRTNKLKVLRINYNKVETDPGYYVGFIFIFLNSLDTFYKKG
jgi:hypothetical protein